MQDAHVVVELTREPEAHLTEVAGVHALLLLSHEALEQYPHEIQVAYSKSIERPGGDRAVVPSPDQRAPAFAPVSQRNSATRLEVPG